MRILTLSCPRSLQAMICQRPLKQPVVQFHSVRMKKYVATDCLVDERCCAHPQGNILKEHHLRRYSSGRDNISTLHRMGALRQLSRLPDCASVNSTKLIKVGFCK